MFTFSYNKNNVERFNNINNFLGTSKGMVENNTYHLAIVKLVFNYLTSNELLKDSMSDVEKLNVINNTVEEVTSKIILDRTKLKSMFVRKLNHHYKGCEEPYYVTNLAEMSADYGEVDRNLDISIIAKNLTFILNYKD